MTAILSHDAEPVAPPDIPLAVGAKVLVWSEVYVDEIEEWRDLLHTYWRGEVVGMPDAYDGPADDVNVFPDVTTKWKDVAYPTGHPKVVSPSYEKKELGPGGGDTLQRMVFRVIQAAPPQQDIPDSLYASRLG